VTAGLTAAGRGAARRRGSSWAATSLREGDAGAALASFGQAVDDPRGALEFAKAARWGSTDEQERAREVMKPFVRDDPDGTLTYQLGLVHYWLDDFPASLECHERAAAKGNADALFELYVLHGNGDGVEADPDAAHEWLVKAADKDNSGRCTTWPPDTPRATLSEGPGPRDRVLREIRRRRQRPGRGDPGRHVPDRRRRRGRPETRGAMVRRRRGSSASTSTNGSTRSASTAR